VLGQDPLAGRIEDGARWLYNVDASRVILGHSDLVKPEVFDLIWAAALAARRSR